MDISDNKTIAYSSTTTKKVFSSAGRQSCKQKEKKKVKLKVIYMEITIFVVFNQANS